MKSLKFSLLLVGFSLLFSNCIKDHCKQQIRMYFPVYKTREALLNGVKLLAPQAITKAGKIFSYANYLFINEIDKGIHVIDNTDPKNPVKIGFLTIEGNLDLWVKNNLLYADCYDNLLVLDISNIHSIIRVESLPEIFPQRSYNGANIDETKGYVVGWDQRDTSVAFDCNKGSDVYTLGGIMKASYSMEVGLASSSNFIPPSGVAGSLTRFNVTGNYLYCVDEGTIHSFNIAQQKPSKGADIAIGWGLETIFSFNNNLFIGTSTGVLIYSLSNPVIPAYVNKMQHVRTCDPVITDGEYAFLTLRGGSACGGFTNQLDVLNVKDLQNVSLIKSYALASPYGLGMDAKYLFVCDDGYGIRVFDRSDVLLMNEINKIVVEHPRDIIVLNNSLLVLTDTKMVQFDYSDIQNVKLVSQIN